MTDPATPPQVHAIFSTGIALDGAQVLSQLARDETLSDEAFAIGLRKIRPYFMGANGADLQPLSRYLDNEGYFLSFPSRF